ncbi:MAG: adenylyltransferase/cytidyltransferase family protein [Syntrophorhabdaceae bacterium]|nr:adenylyltransferase/cytidyltransferase family protein [Syntrophorhabdaceae bacterium]
MGRIVDSIDELKSIVDNEKNRGKTIVFGNGCFDILHVGHIRYLKGAKALGDVLIVAINDDSSLVGLGKRKETITPDKERAEIVASLECVDYVILFGEPDVRNILLALKPHIHAKGTDYTEETVPERDVVLSFGGKIAIVGDPKNHSTREIIASIMRKKDA